MDGSAVDVTIELDADLATALSKEARRQHKSRAAVVTDMLRSYLEDRDDYRDAVAILKKGNTRVPLAEAKKRLGLAD